MENIFEVSPEIKKLIDFLFDKYVKYIEYRFNTWLLPVETELSRINIIRKIDNKYNIQARNTGLYIGEISLTAEKGICYCINEEYEEIFGEALK